MAAPSYDCSVCPAYCCSYPRVIVSQRDIEVLAAHFDLAPETARERFTKKGYEPGERVLRHRRDHVYETVCRFLDPEERTCTVYEVRPGICREYPGPKCGYFDFLSFERHCQEDPEFIPSA